MLDHVGSRCCLLKCPITSITKAPTLQASSWTGRPMSSRSTWRTMEDEIPGYLLMRWRHVTMWRFFKYLLNKTMYMYVYIYNYIYIGENTYNRCFVCIQQLLGRSEVGSFNRRGTVKVTVSPGGMYGGTPSSPWLTLLAELDGNRVKLDVWDLYPQITVSRGEIMINHEENVGVP